MSRRFRDVLLRRLDAALVPAEPIEEPGDEWYAREMARSDAQAYATRRRADDRRVVKK